MRAAFSILVTLAATVGAECACGYTVNGTEIAGQYALFTDLLETDFLYVKDVTYNSSYDIGWIPQNYNTSAALSGGPYGMAKESSNLVANYIDNEWNYVGPGVLDVCLSANRSSIAPSYEMPRP